MTQQFPPQQQWPPNPNQRWGQPPGFPYGGNAPVPPPRKRWPWIAGGAGVVALVVVGLVIAVSTKHSGTTKPAPAALPSITGSPALKKKFYTNIPESCLLADEATLTAAHLDFRSCQGGLNTAPIGPADAPMLFRSPSWKGDAPQGLYQADARLTTNGVPSKKDEDQKLFTMFDAVAGTDNPLQGVGDDSYVFAGPQTEMVVGKVGYDAMAVINDGNVNIVVDVKGYASTPEAENAAVALAKNVLSKLS
ncbi:hypothetical protein [Nocardia sp. NPDC020380]|uniref:hypothetical protein n=1 Tax=Nocardia sp. NPDC020380 TaxID=3364309 RepID=UPI0037B99D11